MKNNFILTLFLLLLILYSFFTACSFDYDNDYINEPPDSVIGKPCQNEGDTVKYTYGDYYYCAGCFESADGLVWFEISCEEYEDEDN